MPDQHPTEDIASAAREPIDSDVDLHPGGLGRRGRGDATVLAAIAAGGASGASVRYLTDRAVQSRHDTVFPWGTLTVNVIGSLILGLITGAVAACGASPQVQLAVGTGFCVALTTYSTFSCETLRLMEDDARFFAAANVAASIVTGLCAAFLGVAISKALWS